MNEHIPSLAAASDDGRSRRSLILAGGGMRVAWQAGVLRALEEAGITFAHGDGTSGGTINLAMLFSGITPVDMCDRWRTLRVKEFVSFLPIEKYLDAANIPALGDADGIINDVFPHLGIDVATINAAHGMRGTFNVCNYSRKTNEAIAHTTLTLDLLVAGISLPIFMPAVAHNGDIYLDSVWIKDANLMEAVRGGAEELWLVWCIGNHRSYKGGAFNQYVHMIELSANGGLFEEFDRINELNERITRGDSPYGQRHPIRLHVIKPDHPLPLDPDLYAGRIDTATLIDMGYRDAKQYLRDMRDEGIPFTPEATQMSETTTGITFRETMKGGFALDEIDPKKGEEKGDNDDTTLTMHATITIDDLQRFIDDPQHLGSITGHIDYPPFGNGIPSTSGVFNLFSPTGDPKLKLMVYELGFEHNGQSYYLAGRKNVRQESALELWKDTTTLYTMLHKGHDKTGQVVGAGVLSLSIAELLKMIPTIHATGAGSAGDHAKALFDFGRFFLGDLWDTYGPKLG